MLARRVGRRRHQQRQARVQLHHQPQGGGLAALVLPWRLPVWVVGVPPPASEVAPITSTDPNEEATNSPLASDGAQHPEAQIDQHKEHAGMDKRMEA